MTPHSPIRELLRLRENDAEVLGSDETEILVDREGGVVKGVAKLWRVHRRYLVRAGREVELQVKVPLRDFENSVTVDVPYRCQMTLVGAPNEVVRQLFHRDDTPWMVLEEKLRQATEQWWRNDGVRRGLPIKEAVWLGRAELQAAIKLLLEGLGFQSRVVADVDGWKIPPIPVKNLSFLVRLSDYPDREFNLTLSTELVVAPGASSDSRQPSTFSAWEDRVRDCVRLAAKQSVSLHTYFHDRAGLEDLLRGAIDRELGLFGRKCAWISTNTEKASYPASAHYDVKFSWAAMHGRQVAFAARMQAFVTAGSEAQYLRSGSPSLQGWFEKHLTDAAHRLLLRNDYSTLTPEYAKAFQGRLEAEIKAEATAIGVSVEGLVLLSKLPEWEYLSPFEVDIPARDYPSVTTDASLRFTVNIKGRFNELADVTKLTSPSDVIRPEIERRAIRAASEVSRGVHLHDYLSRFDPSSEDAPEAGPCVRVQIESAIVAALSSELGLAEIKVQVRQSDSDIKKFADIFAAAEDRKYPRFDVRPKDAGFISEKFELDVKVRLNAIAPSRVLMLKQKRVTPEEIFSSLHGWMLAELGEAGVSLFRQGSATRKDPLRTRVAKRLAEEALNHYGAVVEILDFQVVKTLNMLLVEPDVGLRNEVGHQTLLAGYAQLDENVKSTLKNIVHGGLLAEEVREGDRQLLQAQNAKQVQSVGEQSTDLTEDPKKLKDARDATVKKLGIDTAPLLRQSERAAGEDLQRSTDESGDSTDKPKRGPY